jgi:hypothetical protein
MHDRRVVVGELAQRAQPVGLGELDGGLEVDPVPLGVLGLGAAAPGCSRRGPLCGFPRVNDLTTSSMSPVPEQKPMVPAV